MRKFPLVIIVFLIQYLPALSQQLFPLRTVENPQVSFIRFSANDGLSSNHITALLQDHHNFIWIGTTEGLNRYDGRSFEVYKHNEDNYTSLRSSFITSLAEDDNGTLWVGTRAGLHRYDRLYNQFEFTDLNRTDDQDEQYIRALLPEGDSVLWADLQNGTLIRYNLLTKKVDQRISHVNSFQPYYLYHALYRDKDDRLWIGVRGRPLMYIDKGDSIVHYIEGGPNRIHGKRANDVASYFEDSDGNFFVTGLDGVYLLDFDSNHFAKQLSTTTYGMLEDNQHNIWIATGSGVFKYDRGKQVLMKFVNEKDNPKSISDNSVTQVMRDHAGNIWFGTAKGINVYNPPPYAFNNYTHIPGIVNSPQGYTVTAAAQDLTGKLWLGYEEDGLDEFNFENDKFVHYGYHADGSGELAANQVSALMADRENRLWIGLWRGVGFDVLELNKKNFLHFRYQKASMEKDWYADFCEDEAGQHYVAFWGGEGLIRFNTDPYGFGTSLKDKFERMECSRIISRLLVDSENSIWAGTTECGLHRYFPESDSAISWFSDKGNSGLLNNDVKDIAEDELGNIWVLSSSLQRYLPEKDSFSTVGLSGGLPANGTAMLFDEEGELWISTAGEGLIRYSRDSESSKHYKVQDGIQGNTFTKARLKLNDGRLLFGGTNGFTIFDPVKIVENDSLPKPSFGRLMIYDHIQSHDLNQQRSFSLDPSEKVFSVELNSTDLINSERYSYQVRLIGFDEDWVDVDNQQRKVRYASVPPGRYEMVYRIGDGSGNWSDKTAWVDVIVERPFYMTFWFSGLIILLVALLLLYIIRRREHNLKVEGRNIELQQRIFRLQMNPHFMGNSLLAIQGYIYNHSPREAGDYLSDFARLFRLILNNSKSEFITLARELETLELYLKLQGLRFPEKFDYELSIDEQIDPDEIMIPPMLAQPMIENALEHGLFKKKGQGMLWIRFKLQPGYLLFEVEDDGIGLTAARELMRAQQDHISSATKITNERIRILGRKYHFMVIFEVKEKVASDGTAEGTLVRFTLPYQYISEQ